jgi:hypothetical protein
MNTKIDHYFLAGKNFFQIITFFSFLLAVFSLNFPIHYLNLFLTIWMVLNGVEILLRGKYRFELPNKNNLHLYFLLALYIWMVISLLWTSNFEEAQKLLIRRISFLIFPVYALMGFNKYYRLKPVLLTFIAGTFVSIVVLAFVFCMRYMEHSEWFMDVGFNVFFQDTISLYKHRTYFSLCMIFSLIFYIYMKGPLIKKTSGVFYYTVLFIMVVLFFSIIYFSQSRMSLIIFLLVTAFIGFYLLWEKGYKKITVLFLCTIAFSAILLLHNHSRMQNLTLDKEKLQQFDPRYELWRNALECIHASNIFLGVGIGDRQDVFEENHQKPHFKKYYFATTDSHNEFLKTQLELGIIGNLLLVGIIIALLLNNRKGKDRYFVWNVVMIWLLFMLIETIGITSTSTYMFVFSLLIVYWVKSGKIKTPDIINRV